MSEFKQPQLIEAVLSALPYPDQIRDLSWGEPGAIRFTWRGDKFRVSATGHCEEVGEGVLTGSNISILAGVLIRRALVEIELRP